ncbi:hypothetical protein J3F84DRAFT_240992 [Trichoderma pleuroticola]
MGHRRETLPGTQTRLILGTGWRRDGGGRLREKGNHVTVLFVSLVRRWRLHLGEGRNQHHNGICRFGRRGRDMSEFGRAGTRTFLSRFLAEGESASRVRAKGSGRAE